MVFSESTNIAEINPIGMQNSELVLRIDFLESQFQNFQDILLENSTKDASLINVLDRIATVIKEHENRDVAVVSALENLNKWTWSKDLPMILALIANTILVVVTWTNVKHSIKTSDNQARQNKKLLEQNREQLEKLEIQLNQNEKLININHQQSEISKNDYFNKSLIVIELEFEKEKIKFSKEEKEGYPKYIIFEDDYLSISNISDFPAHRFLVYNKILNNRKAVLYDYDEDIEYTGGPVSFFPVQLGNTTKKINCPGFKIEMKKTNIDKIFIDYQINYKDLLGKKYSVLYTYCILTIKSLKTIESHLSDYRLIIDGIDISHGRSPLIMPYKAIYPNEADNEKDKS